MYPMYYGFGMDPAYLALVIISLVLGGLTQSYINSTYRKWSRVPSGGETGEQVARRMLDSLGCGRVGIRGVSGHLTDHYDPRDNNLYLSRENLSGGSVASVAVACHEAGHAAQREHGYAMMKFRSALVLAGVFMNIAGLTTLAIALFSFSVLFQIVTLPVEIDASRRAVAYIEQSGMGEVNVRGAKKVLTAAALTYVAAALTSVLQLLYIMGRTRNDE